MKHTDIEISRQLETPAPYTPDMTTTVGKLLHLRHVVERIPPKRFDMDNFMEKSICGTAGCMLGWASVDGSFQKIGLGLIVSLTGSAWVSYNGEYSSNYWDAACEAFNITASEASALFTSTPRREIESYPIKINHGLARIDYMIEKYSK